MKQLIKNYTISTSAKTITLTDFSTNPIVLERLLLITDVTNQNTVYQFNVTTGVTAATNVLTFTTFTAVTSNSDKLQIYYDAQAGDPVYDSGESQTKLTNGTNTADVVAGDTGFNGVAVASATKTYTFTTSASGAQTILANTPTEGFSWIEVVYTSVGSGLALTGMWSTTSGGTYVNSSHWSNSNLSAPTALGVAANVIYFSAIRGNYFQLAVSALTSGTFTGTVTLRGTAPTATTIGSFQEGTWTVGSNSAIGSAVPANAFYAGIQNGSGNLQGLVTVSNAGGDGQSATTTLAAGGAIIYNGTNWDRSRTATAASNTTGTGLLGVGNLGYDGTNWQTIGAPLQTTTTSNTAQGMMLVGSGIQSNTFSVTSVSSGTTYDVGNFASVKVQITSQYTGTSPAIFFQSSNDGTNWYANPLALSNATNGDTNSTQATGMFFGPLIGRYFRLNFTGTYTSGTTAGLIVFSTVAYSERTVVAGQTGTWNVGSSSATGSAVPTTAFYMGMQGPGGLVGLGSVNIAGASGALSSVLLATSNYLYNGTTRDEQTANMSVVVVAAGQTSTTTQTLTTYNARSLLLAINIVSGAGTVTVAISGSTVSGYTYPILTSTALTGVADNTLRVFPGATPATNTAANDILPRTLSITYTVVGTIAFGSDAVLSV